MYDTPGRAASKYAERHSADAKRWHFLTGVKLDVYKLSVDGLKFTVLENDEQS